MNRILKSRAFRIALVSVLLVITLAGIATVIFRQVSASKKNSVKRTPAASVIQYYNVALSDYAEEIEVSGQVTYFEKVTVSSKVSGRLMRNFLIAGKSVGRGQKIAEIEKLQLELNLKQQLAEYDIALKALDLSRAKYENAVKSIDAKWKLIEKARFDVQEKEAAYLNYNRTLENKKALFEIGGVSATELESAKTQHTAIYAAYQRAKNDFDIQEIGFRDSDIQAEGYKVPAGAKDRLALFVKINTKIEYAEYEGAKSKVRQSEKAVEATRIMLRETDIFSPIEGVVATKDIEVGEIVKNESTIGTIMNISKVYVVFNISEKDFQYIRSSQNVQFTVDAVPDTVFTASIERIAPFLDLKTRTIEVKAVTQNPTRRLLPGMFARAKIRIGVQNGVIAIPLKALVSRTGTEGEVYVVSEAIIIKRKVTTGKTFGEMVQIVQGLKKQDVVVSEGLNLVYPGMKADVK